MLQRFTRALQYPDEHASALYAGAHVPDETAPAVYKVAPVVYGDAPAVYGVAPMVYGVAPMVYGDAHSADELTPAPDEVTPGPDGVTPEPDGVTPEPDEVIRGPWACGPRETLIKWSRDVHIDSARRRSRQPVSGEVVWR